MNLNIISNNEQSSQSTFMKGDIVIHKAFDVYNIMPTGIAAIPILCVIFTDGDFMTCFDTHTNKEIVVPINQFRKISYISL